MPKHPDLSDADFEAMRRTVLHKLGQMNAKLEQMLAGENVTLEAFSLMGDPDPSWLKIEKLRYYIKELNLALRRVNERTVGFCRICEKPIAAIALREMPWADVCEKDAGR